MNRAAMSSCRSASWCRIRTALPISHVVVHEPPAPPAPVLVPYDWALEDIIDEDGAR